VWQGPAGQESRLKHIYSLNQILTEIMKIEVSITKQHILSLFIAIAIVAGISYAIAQTPNPGHPYTQIDFTGVGSCSNICTDADTDTKCDTLNACSQVCIGNACKNSWPTISIDYTSCVDVAYSTSGAMKLCPTGYVVVGIASGPYGCATGCAHLAGPFRCCPLVLS